MLRSNAKVMLSNTHVENSGGLDYIGVFIVGDYRLRKILYSDIKVLWVNAEILS